MSDAGARNGASVERRVATGRQPSWLHWAARLGYLARGIVYVLMGAFALAVAVGLADRAAGSGRVLSHIARVPFGELVLALLAVGLLGYATLSIVASATTPERSGLGALPARVADAIVGALYLGLALLAIWLIAEPGLQSGDLGERWAARVLALPGGSWLLGAGALLVLAGAGVLLFRAARYPFGDRLDRRRLNRRGRAAIVALARLGTAARGIAFALCGAYAIRAAVRDDPASVRGLGGALAAIGRSTAGPWLLALVAIGFVAYGAYQIAKVRFRRLELG